MDILPQVPYQFHPPIFRFCFWATLHPPFFLFKSPYESFMTRNGNIARLPDKIRDQLNRRLRDGEHGNLLVEWLNKLPAVKKVLRQQFDSNPVTEQNLSEWKNGGHQDWLHHQESIEFIANITEQGEELQQASRGGRIAEGLANWLSAEFLTLARKLLEDKADPQERWNCLREIFAQLSHLRRDDHSAERVNLKREKWEHKVEHDVAHQEYTSKLGQTELLFNQLVLGELKQQGDKEDDDDEDEENPTESDSIQVNPTESDH
jgi:hypothetical protein